MSSGSRRLKRGVQMRPTPGTPGTPLELAKSLGNVSSDLLDASFSDQDWGGTAPVLSDGVLSCGAAADPEGRRWRSEVIWSTGTEIVPYFQFGLGERVVSEFDVCFTGLATGADDAWNVLWQLIGHTVNSTQQWPGPPLTLAYENGTFRLCGGAATPTGNTIEGQTPGSQAAMELVNQYSEAPGRMPGADSTWYHWLISVYLGGPGEGMVDAWCDDVRRADAWQPTSGTFYTAANGYANAWLYVKNGLYGGLLGSFTSPQPRSVETKNIRITHHKKDGSIDTYRA